MERNEEGISTRDLASPGDARAREAMISTREGADGTSSAQAQAEVYDRPAGSGAGEPDPAPSAPQDEPVDSATRSPADDDTTDSAAADGPTARTRAEGPTEQPLLTANDGAIFQRRWEDVQTRFVDEPRGAVEDADGLVANLMQQLAQGFAQERERLEAHWDRGEDISTEDLRVALQRYRSFFQRLLTT